MSGNCELDIYIPSKVAIQITTKCQNKCLHCYFNSKDRTDIDMDIIKSIAESQTLKKLERIIVYGGEPLLNKNLYFILSSFYSNNIEPILITNGLLLDEKVVENFKNIKLKSIVISVDNFHKNTDDINLQKIKQSVILLNQIGIKVIINCVVSKKDTELIQSIISSFSLIVEQITFLHYTPIFNNDFNNWFDANSWNDFIEKIKDSYIENNIVFQNPFCNENFNENNSCKLDFLYIDVKGNLYPCSLLTQEKYLIGNLMNTPLDLILKNIGKHEKHEQCVGYINNLNYKNYCLKNDYKQKVGCQRYINK